MYTSGVQCITQNKIPIKLLYEQNSFFESLMPEKNRNKPNYIGEKIKCEN